MREFTLLILISAVSLSLLGCRSASGPAKELTIDQQVAGEATLSAAPIEMKEDQPRPGFEQEPQKSQNP